jgi:hypothetical protein
MAQVGRHAQVLLHVVVQVVEVEVREELAGEIADGDAGATPEGCEQVIGASRTGAPWTCWSASSTARPTRPGSPI